MAVGGGVNELGGDPDAVAGTYDAPFDYRIDAQLPADVGQRLADSFVTDDRRSRDHSYGVDLPQLRDECVGDGIGQKLLVNISGQVLQGKDRQRLDPRWATGPA